MKFGWEKHYFRWGVTAFLVIAASMLFYFGIFRMNTLIHGAKVLVGILAPVLYGAILAYLLTPIVTFLEEKVIIPLLEKKWSDLKAKTKRIVRYVSVIITTFLFIFLIYALIMMILPQLIQSVVNILNNFPHYMDVAQDQINAMMKKTDRLDPAFTAQVDGYLDQAQNFLTTKVLPQLQTMIKNFSEGVFDLVIFLKNFLIGIIVSIYVMADREEFVAKSKMIICAILPTHKANAVIRAMRLTDRTFGGFISGKILDSVIIGMLCYIGTTIIGTPYAILVSVIIGITNVIPFFGPYLGAVPCTVLILLIEPIQALYFVIFILVLQQFDGNILGPKILGGSTGLSSFMVIVAILVGGGLFGVPGMIAGVPVFAVLYAIIWGFISRSLHRKDLPVEMEEYLNLDRIDNITHQTQKFENKVERFGLNADEEAKDYNVFEVEQIFSEISNAEYTPCPNTSACMNNKKQEEEEHQTLIMSVFLKVGDILWNLAKILYKKLLIAKGKIQESIKKIKINKNKK